MLALYPMSISERLNAMYTYALFGYERSKLFFVLAQSVVLARIAHFQVVKLLTFIGDFVLQF
jgi:hypothetical protein